MSDKFRRQLRQEVEKWRREGLIEDALYEQLCDRYQLHDLESSASNRFILILLGLSSLLLGLGMITFVAANWQVWTRELKVALLLSSFIGVNAVGFYLWRRTNQQWQRHLGQALLLLGALILGANLMLMSQIFHQRGQVYQLYIVWSLGVLAMAYSLRIKSLGLLACLLIWFGYLRHLWEPQQVTLAESWLQIFVQHLPLLIGLLFIPLAYWCGSKWIFRLSSIAMIFALEVNMIRFNLLSFSPNLAAIFCGLPPAFFWSYNDSFLSKQTPQLEIFSSIARSFAIIFLSLLFYVLSFYRLWTNSLVNTSEDALPLVLYPLADIIILSALTLWQWIRLLKRNKTNYLVASLIIIGALVPVWHLSGRLNAVIAVLIFNLLLLLLAVGLIQQGLTTGKRRLFWGGMILLTLQIFTRMIEYDTDLFFKSFVCFLSGFGLLGGGLWFERRLRIKRISVKQKIID